MNNYRNYNIQTIEATANHAKRTFTLRTFYNSVQSTKYRTIPLSKEEFKSCLNNTENDWKEFLKSDDYYEVK